jgi:hypothetical protein
MDVAKTDQVLSELEADKADLVVLPEALPDSRKVDNHTDTINGLYERFERAGYDFSSVNNFDADRRGDARQTGIALRRGAGINGTPEPIRLATRNAWYLPHVMPGTARQIEFFGVHLNDRGNDERKVQIDALASRLNPEAEQIVIGDINADYKTTAFRGFCRVLGLATSFIPESQPKKLTNNLPTPGRIRSIARRLDEATDGTTMRELLELGLHDADELHQPTSTRMKFLLLSLDRGLVSEGVVTSDFKVAPQTVSDHSFVSFKASVRD